MPTDTQVNDLKINVLSEAQYEQIASPSATELYLVPEVVDTTPTSGSTNPITSGGVYNALQNIPSQEQSDWNETDNTDPAYIKNKPQNIVTDASYVHTDNNYTTTEKNKLAGIANGAEVNVQSDWNQSDSTADDYIKNKPTIPTVNDSTITILSNNEEIDSFTLNAESDSSINIPDTDFVYVVTSHSNNTLTAVSKSGQPPIVGYNFVYFPSNTTLTTSSTSEIDITLKIGSSGTAYPIIVDDTRIKITNSNPYTFNKGLYFVQLGGYWYFDTQGCITINGIRFSCSYYDLDDVPTLSTVATSGDYDDLTNKPTIPDDTVSMVYCDTEGSASAKVGKCTGFVLKSPSYMMVTMKNANSYSTGQSSLNINSTGAKKIFINGTTSSSSNYTLPAGTYLVYYSNSTYYFRTDGKMTIDTMALGKNANATDGWKLSVVNNTAEWDWQKDDISTADGNFFPNAVQDYDGNWYSAVIIGEQVWLGENLRTTHYSDGTAIANGGSNSSDSTPYYYNYTDSTVPLEKRGLLYNWPAVMNGAASSSANPSGVQGIAPTGWHVPSSTEFTNAENYVKSQKRYLYDTSSSSDTSGKAFAYNGYWTNSNTAGTIGNDISSNNASGFSIVPSGFRTTSFYLPTSESRFFTTTENNSNTSNVNIYQATSSNKNITSSNSSKSYGYSVRCVCDMTPSQFRAWYVAQYGTLQHHLEKDILPSKTGNAGKVLAVNSGETGVEWVAQSSGGSSTLAGLDDTTISSPSNGQIITYDNSTSKWVNMNMPTIPAAQVNSDWNASSGVAQILNKPDLATVATTGSYNDLTDTPKIPDEVVWVTFEADSLVDGQYTANMTPTEIYEYINSGACVLGIYVETLLNNNGEITILFYCTNYTISASKPIVVLSMTFSSLRGRTNYQIVYNSLSGTWARSNQSFGDSNVQSDWNQTDTTADDYIKNKPTIPTVPTNVSDFTNDAGYITASDVPVEVIWFTFSLSGNTYVSSITPAQILAYLQAGKCVLGLHPNDKDTDTKDVYHCMKYVYNEKSGAYLLSFANAKTNNLVYFLYDSTIGYWKLYEYQLQNLLIGSGAGQNIKTINNTSLLGTGNIDTTEVFVCTFTGTSAITCDKTMVQIYDAYQNEKCIIGIRSNELYNLSYCTSTIATFYSINSPNTNNSVLYAISTSDSGATWTKTEFGIQKQLVSSGTGQNIKTINNESLLGSGNITVGGGDVNVQSDWNQSDSTADDFIKNKPTLGTAAAKNVPSSGNASTTEVVMGNDSRLTDARTPTAHTHGNITNDGKVGSASGKILTTGTGGAVQASDSITKSMISDFPSLATVATSGSYNDLTDTPTIPDDSGLVHLAGEETITGAKTLKEDLTLKSASVNAASPFLIFQRGTSTDTYVDWKLNTDGGYFNFYRRYNDTDVLKFRLYNTGNDFTNLINAPSFVKTNPTNATGILLVDGSDIAQSTFQPALPSYTGNSGKVLAVNSGATGVEWINQSGGGGVTVDTEISETSTNPVQNKAIGAELRKLWNKKDIVSRLDSDYTANNNYISSSTGKWVSSSTYKHWVVPINDIREVTVVANSSTAAYVSFFDTYSSTTSGTTPDYSTGWDNAVAVTAGTSSTFQVPDGAMYMYLNTGSSNAAKASHIYATGIGITDEFELPSLTNNSGKVLAVNGGETGVEWIKPVSVYNGTTTPSSELGSDGDIYIQTTV